MEPVRSLLVLLSVFAWTSSGSPTNMTPTPGDVSSSEDTSKTLAPRLSIQDADDTPLNRYKKSAPGTCVTVNEPNKPPFTLCNDGATPAVSSFEGDLKSHNLGGGSGGAAHVGSSGIPSFIGGLHGGNGGAAHVGGGGIPSFIGGLHGGSGGAAHVGGGGIPSFIGGLHGGSGGAAHVGGGGIPSFIGGLHGAQGLGSAVHFGGDGAHGSGSTVHFGGAPTPHQLGAAFAGPQVAVHPALHPGLAPHGGFVGAGYGQPVGGFTYGGQRFFPIGGGLYGSGPMGPFPNRYGLLPAYDQFTYGASPYGQYRALDEDDAAVSSSEGSSNDNELEEMIAQEQAPQASSVEFRALDPEQALAAAAVEGELAAQALAEAQVHAMHQQVLEQARQAQLDRAMETSFRSAPGPPYGPILPPLLQTGGGYVGVFPPGAGGGCGSLPLLFSCSPQVVRGHLLQPSHSSGGHYPYHQAYTGAGAAYRQSGQQAEAARGPPSATPAPPKKSDKLDSSAGAKKIESHQSEKKSSAEIGQENTKSHVSSGEKEQVKNAGEWYATS